MVGGKFCNLPRLRRKKIPQPRKEVKVLGNQTEWQMSTKSQRKPVPCLPTVKLVLPKMYSSIAHLRALCSQVCTAYTIFY